MPSLTSVCLTVKEDRNLTVAELTEQQGGSSVSHLCQRARTPLFPLTVLTPAIPTFPALLTEGHRDTVDSVSSPGGDPWELPLPANRTSPHFRMDVFLLMLFFL